MTSVRPLKIAASLHPIDRLYVAIVAMQLPFVLVHLHNLWTFRSHYEFFPFVLLAAGGLMASRWPQTLPERTASLNTLCRGMLMTGLALMAAAVIFVSPWLAAVAFLINLGGLLIRVLGPAARDLLGPWMLCWLVIPPPLGLDGWMIGQMQSMTSTCVSRLLEWGGMLHIRVGNTFELSGHRLFVAEACSGIHSQLVLITVCLVLMVYQRRRIRSGILMVVAASFWSLAANVTRIMIVVLAAAHFDIDISEGWAHECLGFLLIVAGFAMLLSTDHLFRGIAALREPPDYQIRLEETSDLIQTVSLWRRQAADWCFGSREAYQTHCIVPRTSAQHDRRFTNVAPPRPLVVFTSLIAILASLQVVVLASGHGHTQLVRLLSWLPEDTMPQEAGPWKLKEYTEQHRDRHSDQGESSQIWRYVSQSAAAQVSVDYPFCGWHQLTRCYTSRGWSIVSEQIRSFPRPDGNPDDPAQCVEVQMVGPSGQYGLLIYSLLDRHGETLAGETHYWHNRVANSPLIDAMSGSSTSPLDESTLQVQVLTVSEVPLTDRQSNHCRELYVAAHHRTRHALLSRMSDVDQ
ncbi:exosortase U [Roseiconus nitratireducens]|uniref:Exosortase U n=1 Tax=Roseiconus nitratireducens TaxID=2605748 RepID=A0A5M6CZX5_9BACT|nr:exosortase U [Roseiconus nitratireducens]KAA5540643.1 exosortase U [Roseiconus nitratireducens]